MDVVPHDDSLHGIYVFVVWPSARDSAAAILGDLAARYDVLSTVDLTWTPLLFEENLVRFYGRRVPVGDKGPPNGRGSLLVVVVRDPAPTLEYRFKSTGLRLVNKSVLASKERYRAWTGGAYRVHCSVSASETVHDLGLLFGPDYRAVLAGQGAGVVPMARDVTGAGGWASAAEFWETMNLAVPYVYIGDDATLDSLGREGATSIRLMVGERNKVPWLLGGATESAIDEVGRMRITVAGHAVHVLLHDAADGPYDRLWQTNMLQSRRLQRGVYVPDPDNRFHALLYDALVHGGGVPAGARATLDEMARALHVAVRWGAPPTDPASPEALVAAFLRDRQYLLIRARRRSLAYRPSRALVKLAPSPLGARWKVVRRGFVKALERARLLAPALRVKASFTRRAR